MQSSSSSIAITRTRLLLSRAKSVLVITGAGISVPSGIRPYRGKGGVYDTNPELQEIMTGPNLEKNPNTVWEELNRRRIAYKDATPNKAHEILAKWEHQNRFGRFHLATQNIDDLHPKAGTKSYCSASGCSGQLKFGATRLCHLSPFPLTTTQRSDLTSCSSTRTMVTALCPPSISSKVAATSC